MLYELTGTLCSPPPHTHTLRFSGFWSFLILWRFFGWVCPPPFIKQCYVPALECLTNFVYQVFKTYLIFRILVKFLKINIQLYIISDKWLYICKCLSYVSFTTTKAFVLQAKAFCRTYFKCYILHVQNATETWSWSFIFILMAYWKRLLHINRRSSKIL